MVALVVVLAVLGFVIPAASALVAYRRTSRPHLPDGTLTLGDLDQWLARDIPELLRGRIEAVKWPAVWALVGIGCGSAASVLSVLAL